MKHSYLAFLGILSCSSLWAQQEDSFNFTENKQIITIFSDAKISLGEKKVIFGQEQSMPGIYLKDNGQTYEAFRLTVEPPQTLGRWKPYLQIPTASSILINWKASAGEDAKVRYGTVATQLNLESIGQSEELADDSDVFSYYSVKLKDLKADTKYYYTIAGDQTVYSFRTQPTIGNKRHYRVLMLGDHQLINRSGYEWLYQAAKKNIETKYGGAIEDHIDLILNPGDQVNEGSLKHYERCHFYKSSFFSPRIPIMTTVGNHEYKKDPDVQNYRSLFAYEGLSYQGISSNTDTYYAIQEGSVLFISLCTETETHANNTQVNWLKQVLAAAEQDPTVTFVTSICHRPLCSESYIDDYSPWLKETVVPILSSCRKHVLHVAAHHHYYQRGQVPEGDFHHIISGGASWDQFWSMAPTTYDNDLVQKTHDYWAYQIFDYDPETQKMTVESYSIGNKNVVHNNMLIDRFSRDLSKTARPDKPVLTGISSQVELPTTLQSSDYVSAVSGDFNSAQFQIALSEDFKKPLVDRTQHFENFFKDGGPKFYIPTNTQKDKNATSLLLEKGDLQAGDYFLRVRYRNQNLQWSEWSDAKALHVTLKAIEDVEPSMSFEKNLFKTGEAVAVTFRNVPTNTKAWVGVYKRGTVYPKDKSVKYFYTDGKDDNSRPGNGVGLIEGLPAGEYYMVLFGDGNYGKVLSPHIAFEVSTRADLIPLTLDKNNYTVGEEIKVTYSAGGVFKADWIGIYSVDKEVGAAPGGQPSNVWKTIPTQSKAATLSFRDAKKMPAGTYYAVYLLDGAYEEASQRVFFTIGENLKLQTAKLEYIEGEFVDFNVSGLEFPLSWVVIEDEASKKEVERRYMDFRQSNKTFFKKFPIGKYSATLQLPDNRIAAQSASFTVTKGTGISELSVVKEIYPNPVKDTFSLPINGCQMLIAYTLDGKQVACVQPQGKVVSLASLASGHYFLKAKTKDAVYNYRIVKE